MRFYQLTQAGVIISGRISNPDTPAYKVLAVLRRLHSANTDKLCEVTGMDLGTVQVALAQLASTQPPLIQVIG